MCSQLWDPSNVEHEVLEYSDRKREVHLAPGPAALYAYWLLLCAATFLCTTHSLSHHCSGDRRVDAWGCTLVR